MTSRLPPNIQFQYGLRINDRTIVSAWVQRPSDADFAELRHAGLDAILERAAGLPSGAATQFTPADRKNLKAALGEAMEGNFARMWCAA